MSKKLAFLFLLFVKPLLFASSVVIGIAGASGAGKTTLANKLKETLGEDVVVICQDSDYKDLSHLPPIERDQRERGRQFPDINDQYFSTVRPMFLRHVAPGKAYADLIIPSLTTSEVNQGHSDV